MKQETSELRKLLNLVAKKRCNSYGSKSQWQSFNKTLYKTFKVDLNKIKMKKVESIKEIRNYAKENPKKNVYLLIVINEYFYSAVFTDYESKIKRAVIGSYEYDKVRIKKNLDEGNLVFILSADENDMKEFSDLKAKRQLVRQGSYTDMDSIYFRRKEEYHYLKDKSGYCNKMSNLYKKICSKFLTQDLDVIIEYFSNIEIKLLKELLQIRKDIYKNKFKDISRFGYSTLNFELELSYICRDLYELQNIEEVYKEKFEKRQAYIEDYKQGVQESLIEEIYEYFIKIKEKELDFRERLNEYKRKNKI